MQTGEHLKPDGGEQRRRLFRMGLPELVCRGRQEAFKWTDRLRAGRSFAGDPRPRLAINRERLDPAPIALEEFFVELERRFFEGPFDPDLPATLTARMPEAREAILAAADAACAKRFNLLGHRQLDFGDPIDWHLDPISGRRAPLAHWSRLNPLDPAMVGDSKVIWELNRHQWLVPLAQAYRLTGDPRYADVFVETIRRWLDANPRGVGINWTSSLELAFRIIAWCWCVALFRGAPALTPAFFAAIVRSIHAQATHIERYLSYYFSPNTHLTGEALGLLYAGACFPQFREAGRWRAVATRILIDEGERQILPDGVYFEQSTCYQRYTADIYLHFLILGASCDLAIPPRVEENVRRLLDFLLAVRQPDGSLPAFGDADDGCLLPLTPGAARNAGPMFSTAAAFFGSDQYAWAARTIAADTLWLLGSAAVEEVDALRPAPPPGASSLVFPVGGYTSMRSGWDDDAHQLIFDAGPLGCRISGGHGHADLLSVQCSVFGKPFLIDAGTYGYTAEPQWRDFFRGTAAHSTVMIDGASQALPAGPFAWRARPGARLRCWISNETVDFADADHDAYKSLAEPVSHRRRVLFVKPRYWLLVDDLAGPGTHEIDVRFQFAPMEVAIEASGWTRATADGRCGLLVRAFAGAPLTARVRQGCTDPAEGWVAPAYGQRRPAPLLSFAASTSLPIRIVTVLWPARCSCDAAPALRVLAGRDGQPASVVFNDLNETIRFGDGAPVVEHA